MTIVFSSFISCSTNKSNEVAIIDGESIYLEEIDSLVTQEIYDELYRIYNIRKYSLEHIIKNRVLKNEAIKNEISIDSLLRKVIIRKKKDYSVEQYIFDKNLNNGIPRYGRTYETIDSKSQEGMRLINISYNNYIKERYIDSLIQLVNVNILLEPPIRPRINNLNDKYVHYRGKLDSKISFVLISDFECNKCIENKKLMNEIYTKYKSKVKFGFINYSSYNSPSALALLAAGKQGRFWELYEYINKSDHLIKSDELNLFLNGVIIDKEQFYYDFNSDKLIMN